MASGLQGHWIGLMCSGLHIVKSNILVSLCSTKQSASNDLFIYLFFFVNTKCHIIIRDALNMVYCNLITSQINHNIQTAEKWLTLTMLLKWRSLLGNFRTWHSCECYSHTHQTIIARRENLKRQITKNICKGWRNMTTMPKALIWLPVLKIPVKPTIHRMQLIHAWKKRFQHPKNTSHPHRSELLWWHWHTWQVVSTLMLMATNAS